MSALPPPSLLHLVQRSQRRLRLVAVVDGVLAYGVVGALLAVGTGALVGEDVLAPGAGAVLLALVAVGGLAYLAHVVRRGTHAGAVARRLDGAFGTNDRFATALDLAARGELRAGAGAGVGVGAGAGAARAMVVAQIADAERLASGSLRAAVLPWVAPRHLRTVGLAAALVLAGVGPHFRWGGEGRTVAPRKAAAAAAAATLLDSTLPDLETAAEGSGLRKLGKRVEKLKALVKDELERLEEPDLKLWEIPPDARKDVMPHEEAPDKPKDPTGADKVPTSPAIAGAAAAALALSGVAGYAPVGKFDAGPIDEVDEAAFAELDAKLLKDATLTPEKLMDLTKRVETTAKVFNNFGATTAFEGYDFMEGAGGGGSSEAFSTAPKPTDWSSGERWDAETKGLMMKSMGEFLRKYSFKLKEGALKSALAKAGKDADRDRKAGKPEISIDLPASKVKLTDLEGLKASAPRKGAASMDVSKLGEVGKKLALAALKDGEKTAERKGAEVMGDKTAVGGSGAGRGASDEEKKVSMDGSPEGDDEGEMAPIAGSLGAGDSDITVIRDFSKYGAEAPSTPAYKEIYAGAVKTAVGALDNGSVPPELKELVRLYFTAIRPK